MNGKYLKLFVDSLERCRKLTDSEFGRLVRAALRYKDTDEEAKLTGREELLWDGMRLEMDREEPSERKRRERNCEKYKAWRKSVFKRDNWTCRKCGKRGIKINAHHIVKFADDEDLRFDVGNGTTLCVPCHKNEHRKRR